MKRRLRRKRIKIKNEYKLIRNSKWNKIVSCRYWMAVVDLRCDVRDRVSSSKQSMDLFIGVTIFDWPLIASHWYKINHRR
jgi:hypothetical protein